jgi:hypothetical protein
MPESRELFDPPTYAVETDSKWAVRYGVRPLQQPLPRIPSAPHFTVVPHVLIRDTRVTTLLCGGQQFSSFQLFFPLYSRKCLFGLEVGLLVPNVNVRHA